MSAMKWEYSSFTVEAARFNNEAIPHLNNAGRNGWELVNVVTTSLPAGLMFTFFVKRPLP